MACWIGLHADAVARVKDMIEDMRNMQGADYATLSVAIRSLGQLQTLAAEPSA